MDKKWARECLRSEKESNQVYIENNIEANSVEDHKEERYREEKRDPLNSSWGNGGVWNWRRANYGIWNGTLLLFQLLKDQGI